MTVTWTKELAEAIRGLIAETTPPHKHYRASTDADVLSRAREYLVMRVGQELKPFQVEYTECLVQRLDLDWDRPRDSHTAFRKAWTRAVQLAKPAVLDENGHCVSCGRDHTGHEGTTCSDECPMYWEEVGLVHPEHTS